MGRIPEDAIHWDSGDWIDWHRTSDGADTSPCGAAAENDELARITALHVSLLRAAKSYFVITGKHLSVYPQIAESYAAIHFDLPLGGSLDKKGRVKIAWLTPDNPTNSVEVSLKEDFDLLMVIRISDKFTVEARMITRKNLSQRQKGVQTVTWQSLPRRT